MRVLLFSHHRYPILTSRGSGLRPRELPSGSGAVIHDWIAKGLAELGHEVFYLLPKGAAAPLPSGVTQVTTPISDVDIFHNLASDSRPWVHTIHGLRNLNSVPKNWIFVSQTHANTYGSKRYVRNGIDPSEYIFSEAKEDYFLFISSMNGYREKGLDIALALSTRMGFKLTVAGTSSNLQIIETVAQMCRESGARYVGDLRGPEKAETYAGARALIFPTRRNEPFGLVMAEALMSGTPVICSNNGACPELISADIGFICAHEDDYIKAIENIDRISPDACRNKAMTDYHYLRMTADYIAQYEQEVG